MNTVIPHLIFLLAALQSAVVNFSKIRGEKVDVRDLESIMEGLGINLSNTEFQNALKTIPVDGKY